MSSAPVSTSSRATAAVPTASLSAPQSYDYQQGRPLRSALPCGRWISPDQPNSAANLLGRLPRRGSGNLRAVASIADARTFHSAGFDGANRLASHTLPVEQVFEGIAHRYQAHRQRPFLRTSSAGFKTSRKGLPWNGKTICNRCKQK